MTPPSRWSMSAAAPLAGTPRSTATAVAAARALATSPTRTRMVSGRAAAGAAGCDARVRAAPR